jgi:glycosyltransferase involved in cell wall biosynthesis
MTVTRIILSDRIKIIHARGLIPAMIAFMPAKILKAELLFDTRGLLADKYVCGGLVAKSTLTYKIMRYCEDFLLRNSEIFTVETESHAEVIRKTQRNLASRMRIIPCCVDMSKFDYRLYNSSPKSDLRLIYLGQVGTWYLLDKMMDFFKIMSQEFSHAHFTFISESDPDVFYSTAKRTGVSEDKIQVKRLDIRDIPSLLSVADAGIFFMNPYKRYNTFPIKFGEYLACGLPVVTNAGIGDCDEIIRKENVGVVVKKFTSKEYKNAINALKSLFKNGEALRRRCRVAAEEYCSLAKGVESYLSIYKELAGTSTI